MMLWTYWLENVTRNSWWVIVMDLMVCDDHAGWTVGMKMSPRMVDGL